MPEKFPHISYYLPAGKRRWKIAVHFRGKRQIVSGGLTEASTEKIARKWSEKVELVANGHLSTADLWRSVADRKPIIKHLDDWRESLRIKGTSDGQRNAQHQKVKDLLATADITSIGQIRPEPIARVLDGWKVARALQTLNHYGQAIKQFTRWAKRAGRIQNDPLEGHLPAFNAAKDRRHGRRALTPAEASALLAATEAATPSKKWNAMTPADRTMLYRVALECGFRAGDCRPLTPESFRLDGDHPGIVFDAAEEKAGRGGIQPILPSLATALRKWMKGKPAGEPVFKNMPEKAIRMFRKDLKLAGIEYKTAEGYADFHALRHTTGSFMLAGGANLFQVQKIMRHSDPKLTADRYGHAFDSDLRNALAKGENFRKTG